MTKLTRAINPMPDDVRAALDQNRLAAAYAARPDYQKNDYLGWIARAKREQTRMKRLNQMLDELKTGGAYMNMAWHG
ncbi:MAG TPA: YdeI/OmpD-associated family protein [Mesorhizobium sp.]|jgi:uncharacterized protein YdeI (YjbR/CyaY-like superfamily)|uniref:YdeI/OmpD-associated family protein n=1 Tax=Mesorhizobium sp. TaxID=1871066 RepID=UPI002DDCEC77|nr:YdeI/OmpD-associated family protein [Mesorhizobium sp.]HEV2502147.1 YdeI/OmpD-associated family protein [Mesorhizobium sp.]